MTRLALVLIALALAACGEDRFAQEREQVKELMPGADEIRCTGEPREAVDCQASLKGKPLSCEFRYDEPKRGSYGGTGSCWTER